MEKYEIRLNDIRRILIGQVPAEFLLEVVLRTMIIYVFLLLVVRLMGKRMVGQLTISEMAVMLTLGAIVSPAMQMPATGLLLGIVILLCTLSFQRGINYLEFLHPAFEAFSHGRMVMLLKDGVLLLPELKKSGLSRQQLFTVLRNERIYNLGKIDRIYLEASGLFSIYLAAEAKPGLSVIPTSDNLILSGSSFTKDREWAACTSCGSPQENVSKVGKCPVCNANSWTPATLA